MFLTADSRNTHKKESILAEQTIFIAPLQPTFICNLRSHSDSFFLPAPPISGGRKEVTKPIALLWVWSKHHVDYLSQTTSTWRPTPVFLCSDTPPTIEAAMSGFVDTQACSLTVKSILNRNVEQVGHFLSFSQQIVLTASPRQEILVSLSFKHLHYTITGLPNSPLVLASRKFRTIACAV